MADEVTELVYKGPFGWVLAQMLREEGLSVSFEPPDETSDRDGVVGLAAVSVSFEPPDETRDLDGVVVTGPLTPALWKGVKRFRAWASKQGAPVAIQGLAEIEESIEERLTRDQILSSELHGEAMLTAKRPELQPLIDHLREVAQGRNDIRIECAGILAGSWFSSAARRGEDLIAAGLLMLAGPVDLDELDRWMRTVGSVATRQTFRTGRDS
jgi:hypothetical protein